MFQRSPAIIRVGYKRRNLEHDFYSKQNNCSIRATRRVALPADLEPHWMTSSTLLLRTDALPDGNQNLLPQEAKFITLSVRMRVRFEYACSGITLIMSVIVQRP